MAIRVMQLAKELGVSNDEIIRKLNEIGIAVKTAALPLNDEQEKKARAKLFSSPSEKEEKKVTKKPTTNSSAEKKKVAAKKKEKSKAELEIERRAAAVKAEREARAAERAARGDSGLLGSNVDLLDKNEVEKQKAEQIKVADEKKQGKSKKTQEESNKKSNIKNQAKKVEQLKSIVEETKKRTKQLDSLLDQIENAKERKKIEAEIAKNKQRLAAAAKVVEKQKAVAAKLKQSKEPKAASKTKSMPIDSKPKKVLKAEFTDEKAKAKLGSLLDQISSEKERMQDEGVSLAPASTKKKGKKKKRGSGFEPNVPELEPVVSKEDRYAAMAAAAEKLQRDKVLEEARAAVAAASHEGEGRRKKRKEKREAEAREKAQLEALEKGLDPDLVLDDSVTEISEGATVAEFAEALNVASNDIIKRLFMLGQVLTLTQTMSNDLIELIADDLERKIRIVSPEEEFIVVYNDTEKDLKPRPPVVTVMGHVDHGKTSLLDAIRDTSVIETESGGITQHIGASVVNKNDHQITFIDTPGHEAFTAMRARGAEITDVIVLVVAADDGVMPQTKEAINHAKAADVPVVVAVNKIDKEGAKPDRVKQELTEYGIVPEEWGGSNMFVEISAKKRINIDELLETILLQADVLELKANPDTTASGYVIEANLDRGRGPVATVLVNRGTL